MVDLAAIIVAVAFVVLVFYLVPTILQLKRTVGQSERLLIRLNHELPGLIKEVKGTNENIRVMTEQARLGVDRATVFLNAVGDVGQTVNHVHHAMRGKGGTILTGVTSLMAGVKAASSVMKRRVQKEQEGGRYHGD
ncbi:MAG: DUF948 domain-containing protein [Nitrospirales bacterium]|nr:DUF948 domain-containing protein [Nitrospirales bacterium]